MLKVPEPQGSDGELFIVNRPHIQKFLRSHFIRFLFFHIQNFLWTLERLKAPRSQKAAVSVEYVEKNQDRLIKLSESPDVRTDKAARVAIITPSRLLPVLNDRNETFYHVHNAIKSVEEQVCARPVDVTYIIGADHDAEVPDGLRSRKDVVIARSEGRSQILALNAAISKIDQTYDYVGFLEDDDRWDTNFLHWSFLALENYDFVSSNQLEIDQASRLFLINDFPSPSGWFMPVETLMKIGPVDTKSKWHYDNEWLGRLGASNLTRCHLVEATAPTSLDRASERPGIIKIMTNGGPLIDVQRHTSVLPLVTRLLHPLSGTTKVQVNTIAAKESQDEFAWLVQKYGYIPW